MARPTRRPRTAKRGACSQVQLCAAAGWSAVSCGMKRLQRAGRAEPLGPSNAGSGVNFAVAAPNASQVTLVLFDAAGKELQSFTLPAEQHRTGSCWHCSVQGLPKKGILYAYRVDGQASALRVSAGRSAVRADRQCARRMHACSCSCGCSLHLPGNQSRTRRVCMQGGWDQGHRWDAGRLCIDPYAPLIEGRRRFGVRDEVEQYRPKAGTPSLCVACPCAAPCLQRAAASIPSPVTINSRHKPRCSGPVVRACSPHAKGSQNGS